MIAALNLVFSVVATGEEREDRLGDLTEAFAQNELRAGRAAARKRYRRDIGSAILAIARRRIAHFWDASGLPAMVAILVAAVGFLSLLRTVEEPWWKKSGFDRNPGYFEARNPIDYPVCAAWPRSGALGATAHIVEAKTASILLPRSAKVMAIYCGAAKKFEGDFWRSQCDFTKLGSLLGDNFNYVHDEIGITQGRADMIGLLKGNCAIPDLKIRREAIAGSVRYFPLRDIRTQKGEVYGVLVSGEHQFLESEKDGPETARSRGRFIHLRTLENGQWVMSQAMDYGDKRV